MVSYFPETYYYANQKLFEDNILSLLNQINDTDRVVSLVFFGFSKDELYEFELSTLNKLVQRHFVTHRPLTCYIAQPPAGSQQMAVEVHFIPTEIPLESVVFKDCIGIRYALVNWKNTRTLILEGVRARSLSESYAVQGDELFEKIGAVLTAESININEIVRQWNYIGKITKLNDGVQNYQAFNDARARFYAKTDWKMTGYPAATGIGTCINGLVVSLVATTGLLGIKIDNPLQIAAHAYSKSLLVGGDQRRPKFERARIERNEYSSHCFISGTAAIRGEESVGEFDIGLQTRQTIENISYLISEENLKRYNQATCINLKIASLRVYIKNKQNLDAVKSEINNAWPGLSVIYLEADICRDELLVEIEGTALEE